MGRTLHAAMYYFNFEIPCDSRLSTATMLLDPLHIQQNTTSIYVPLMETILHQSTRDALCQICWVGGFHVNLHFCRILVQQYQLEKSMKPLVKACFTLIFMSIFVSSLTSRMLQLQQLMDKESGHLTITGREGFVEKGRLEMSGVALEWEFEQGNWSSHRWIFGRCRKT